MGEGSPSKIDETEENKCDGTRNPNLKLLEDLAYDCSIQRKAASYFETPRLVDPLASETESERLDLLAVHASTEQQETEVNMGCLLVEATLVFSGWFHRASLTKIHVHLVQAGFKGRVQETNTCSPFFVGRPPPFQRIPDHSFLAAELQGFPLEQEWRPYPFAPKHTSAQASREWICLNRPRWLPAKW